MKQIKELLCVVGIDLLFILGYWLCVFIRKMDKRGKEKRSEKKGQEK